ncbi:hypothetical protein CGMCC3_g8443 [Colletotrichum fructicola]|nr:uncharacterized protein CGMCC3_g8443 [Colletotrichum fructicola]KAE9575708.1 hypothetical protein CGMCC3_g8443 [Colletotrichum fructicola]
MQHLLQAHNCPREAAIFRKVSINEADGLDTVLAALGKVLGGRGPFSPLQTTSDSDVGQLRRSD